MTKILIGRSDIDLDYPICRPSLDLDFTQEVLDSRITFTRGSIGTRVNRNRLIETVAANQPRFDYDPVTGECKGLLIEEQRTNQLGTSIPVTGTWSNVNVDIVSNSIISPDGTQNASLVVGSGSAALSSRYINLNSSITTGTTYTQTFFVKAGTTNYVQIATSTGFSLEYVNFELIGNGRIGNNTVSSAFIQKFPNDWYRIGVTQPATSTISGRMLLCVASSLTTGRLGGVLPYSFYVWGAQLEAGTFPTSYIPTSASTVTRSADNASMTGTNFSSWYNQTGYSVFTSHIAPIPQTIYFPRIFNIGTDASDINRLNFYHTPSTIGYRVGMSVVENNSITNVDFSTTTSQGTKLKLAGAFAENNSSLYINGSIIGTDIKCSINSVTRNILNIGSTNNSQGYLNSTIAKFTYYPKALSPAQLQYLTQ